MIMQTFDAVRHTLAGSQLERRIYSFLKEDNNWYIDLPEYLDKGGSKDDLQLIAGANDFLNLMAWGKDHVKLTMDTIPFVDAVVLYFIQLCKPPRSGGYYYIGNYKGLQMNTLLWLYDIPLLVFGNLPRHIYVRKEQ